MRRSHSRSLAIAALVTALVPGACGLFRHVDTPRRLAGSYSARLIVTGRSTYTGTFTVGRWSADSVVGALTLVSPITVDVAIRGAQTRDSLRLAGSYSAANGCTGTIDSPLVMTRDHDGATGPFTLADKCAGALHGTMELSR